VTTTIISASATSLHYIVRNAPPARAYTAAPRVTSPLCSATAPDLHRAPLATLSSANIAYPSQRLLFSRACRAWRKRHCIYQHAAGLTQPSLRGCASRTIILSGPKAARMLSSQRRMAPAAAAPARATAVLLAWQRAVSGGVNGVSPPLNQQPLPQRAGTVAPASNNIAFRAILL